MYRKWILGTITLAIGTLIVSVGFNGVSADDRQQEAVTATPARINLPSPVPMATVEQQGSVGGGSGDISAVEDASLPEGSVMLEAKSPGVNVRAAADIESERLGAIEPGERYPIMGRYFRWLQLQYESSPTGSAWVYDELVNIIGDESAINDLSEEALPTEDTSLSGATATQGVLTQTPGGVLTATALSRILAVDVGSDADGDGTLSPSDLLVAPEAGATANPVLLPTYTYPPNLPANLPTRSTVTTTLPTSPTDLPPIAPILLLGGLGLIGLAIGSVRR